jgi:outer membrane protein assembly factor BamB
VISYNPEDGKEIWRFLYGEGYSVVPRPLYYDGKIYVCSGFNRAILYAVNVNAESRGDITESNLAWKVEKAIPKESSPIIVNDLLFVNDDKGILSCIDPVTGETHYSERLAPQGGYSSSPVYASGHLFFHNGEGITTVVKPDKRFDKVEENDIGEYGLSSFGVVSDGFIVRTEEALLRIK